MDFEYSIVCEGYCFLLEDERLMRYDLSQIDETIFYKFSDEYWIPHSNRSGDRLLLHRSPFDQTVLRKIYALLVDFSFEKEIL